MLKKLKNKENKTKNNPILDFVMEIKQKYNQKNIRLSNRNENKKLERDLRKLKKEKSLTENYFNQNFNSTLKFNGQPFSIKNQSLLGKYEEDKENINQINLFNLNNVTKESNLNNKINKLCKNENLNKKGKIFNFSHGQNLKNFKEENKNLQNLKNSYFSLSPSTNEINRKSIEFYDEFNNKKRVMPLFEEKDFQFFFKSQILPPVKFMSVDNDVLSEDEQIKDAFIMLQDNLKETIKHAKKDKKYFEKNLTNFDFTKKEN
jgi:hypothetical protein